MLIDTGGKVSELNLKRPSQELGPFSFILILTI